MTLPGTSLRAQRTLCIPGPKAAHNLSPQRRARAPRYGFPITTLTDAFHECRCRHRPLVAQPRPAPPGRRPRRGLAPHSAAPCSRPAVICSRDALTAVGAAEERVPSGGRRQQSERPFTAAEGPRVRWKTISFLPPRWQRAAQRRPAAFPPLRGRKPRC